MKNTKVVLLVASNSTLSSGASWSLTGLAAQLRKMGVDARVLLPASGDLAVQLTECRIPFYIIRYVNSVWIKRDHPDSSILVVFSKTIIGHIVNIIANYRLNILVNRLGIEIIHINALTTDFGARVAIRNGIGLVWHAREFLSDDLDSSFSKPTEAINDINKSNCVIAVSDSVSDRIRELGVSTDILTVYNGVEQERFLSIPLLCQLHTQIRLLMVGRLAPGKRQDLLIQALCKLPDSYKNRLECSLVGSQNHPRYLSEVKNLISSASLNNVHLHGPDNNIEKWYSWCDIVIVCSTMEAFGRTTVEGMLSGRLVIGSDSGGTSELINNGVTGLLFNAGESGSLSQLLCDVIDLKYDIRTIALNAREYASKIFTAKNNASAIFSIYNSYI